MENPTQPTSEATPATRNNEALRILACCLSHAYENNREWRKFCQSAEEQTDQEAELAALDKAQAWLDELPTAPVVMAEAEHLQRVFKPDLSKVSNEHLFRELHRRERAGECVALVITPDDLSEYWECDDSGATHPGSRVPEAEEMKAIVRAFHRWQDTGGFSDIMHTLRDAWQEEQARQLDQEGGDK